MELYPAQPDMIDQTFLRRDGDREAFDRFNARLQQDFVRLTEGPPGYAFWGRRF